MWSISEAFASSSIGVGPTETSMSRGRGYRLCNLGCARRVDYDLGGQQGRFFEDFNQGVLLYEHRGSFPSKLVPRMKEDSPSTARTIIGK